jgi:hypothetical protein
MRVGNTPRPGRRWLSCLLTLSLVLGYPGPVLVHAEGTAVPVATAATLSVETDPAGAMVLVDGQSVGMTPLTGRAIAPGDHRVRVVKEGYLDNSRVVSVQAGQPSRVQVKLTPDGKAPQSRAQVDTTAPPPQKEGGGSKKWLYIGLGAAAVGGAALLLMGGNDPPVAGTISVSPTGTGMAGVTSFSISSQGASDPDNDPLTYDWNFGDGTTGSGQTATKVYAAAGTFSVSLTVSDGKNTVTAPAASVTVARNMAGTWTGATEPGFTSAVSVTLTQSGTTLGGSMTFSGGLSGTVTGLTGTVSGTTYPTTATFTTPQFTVTGFPGTFSIRFSGPTDAAGNTMTGTISSTSTALQPPTINAQTTFRR